MTDHTNKDLPPLPEAINTTSSGKGSWGMRTYGLLFTAKQMRAYARAALSASAPADILRIRQQLEQEWCELQKLKASYASAPAATCPNCPTCPTPNDQHEAAEREHLGCAHKRTGIYGAPAADQEAYEQECLNMAAEGIKYWKDKYEALVAASAPAAGSDSND